MPEKTPLSNDAQSKQTFANISGDLTPDQFRALSGCVFTFFVVVALLLAGSAFLGLISAPNWTTTIQYVTVVAIGALTGMTELVGRYRDQPISALQTPGAMVYVLINALAAAGALFAVKQFPGAQEVVTNESTQVGENAIGQVLLASFGAMAFFRSAIFKARLGETEIPIGPAILFDVLLAAADRDADRRQAIDRFRFANTAMRELDFLKILSLLPTICARSMQNMSAVDQQEVSKRVEEIQKLDIQSHQKSVLLGLVLTIPYGRAVVSGIVAENKAEWRLDPQTPALAVQLSQEGKDLLPSTSPPPAPPPQGS